MDKEQSFRTLAELLDRIEKHADKIYVRAQFNGTWGNHALTELPSAVAILWVLEFIRRGHLPYTQEERMGKIYQRAEAGDEILFEHPDDPVNCFYLVQMVEGKLIVDMFDSLSREPRRQIVIEQINPSKIAITS